jgi:lipopolysaccharide/colanic/teichoic acid biosynthesis glycosyltransferase
LAKERLRADREQGVFGLIILRIVDMRDVRPTSIKLAKLLHRRLRETDEKGHLNYGRIGVVLPCTDDEGTQLVLADVLRLASAAQLRIDGEAFVYPERPSRTSEREPQERDDVDAGDRIEVIDGEPLAGDSQPVASRRVTIAAMPRTFFVAEYPRWKRLLDLGGASLGLLFALPFIAIAALIIRWTSPGPAFFAQERIGFLGQRFLIYKLRTMVANAEQLKSELLEQNERDGPAFKMRNDPRITRFGRFLRSTGLDELPQLWNVLIGDMSLVGPRPLPVEEAEQCVSWQRARMDTKPGLTCYWQLAKTRKISFTEWMRLDMRYARARNFWLDTRLIINTFSAVVLGRVGH